MTSEVFERAVRYRDSDDNLKTGAVEVALHRAFARLRTVVDGDSPPGVGK